jgi:hypothetical protein
MQRMRKERAYGLELLDNILPETGQRLFHGIDKMFILLLFKNLKGSIGYASLQDYVGE